MNLFLWPTSEADLVGLGLHWPPNQTSLVLFASSRRSASEGGGSGYGHPTSLRFGNSQVGDRRPGSPVGKTAPRQEVPHQDIRGQIVN